MATKTKKEKIKIMGKEYKVDSIVNETLKNMSSALHSHEVALLSWVHKDYKGADTKQEKELFRKSLHDYCMQIPDAVNILVRMQELDEQTEKEKENQNKEEKDKGAKE
tara:strand:- start:244 stop:567 length:324 start_codon:yes stop_codon:yes gene_type:complete